MHRSREMTKGGTDEQGQTWQARQRRRQPRQRSDGWEWRYRTPDGRQRSVYGKTRREAQQKMREAQRAHENGLDAARGRQTVAAFLDDWLAHAQRGSAPRPTGSTSRSCGSTLSPASANIGSARLARNTSRRSSTGKPRRTFRRRRFAITGTCCAAPSSRRSSGASWSGMSPSSPIPRACRELRCNRFRHSRPGSLSSTAERDRLGPLFQMAITTGMRQGECSAPVGRR